MNIKIKKIINDKLESNNVNIKIEVSNNYYDISKLVQHIESFERTKIVENFGNELKQIETKEILYFYSDKKYNYCKTLKEEFKIKSKLYELEKMNIDFLRISKSCVINIQNVKCFDLGETGKIVVRFCDNSEQFVSRRKIKDVANYISERRI